MASTRSWWSGAMISTLAPSARQNAASFSTRLRIGAFRRRQDAPAVDEQFGEAGVRARMLGAGDRMRRHEMHVLRQVRRHVAHHRALDRADVGDDGARLQMRADLPGDGAAGADRHADDDEIGALDRGGIALDDLIGKAELGHAARRVVAERAVATIERDRALRARGARDRGADQADADQRETVEEAAVAHACFPRNSASAATTRRLASSVPTVMRSALGKP